MPMQTMYDALYEAVIEKGWSGWGGDDRRAKGPEQVARILAHSAVPRKGKALELGCGEGHLCRLLAQKGYEVTGVDISSVAIRWAQEKNSILGTTIRYVHGDLRNPNFSVLDHFDLIVDGNCFHCILGEHRHVFLRNVSACLAEGGILFISSLCSRDGETHILYRNGQPYRHIPTCDTLREELHQAGFDVLDMHVRARREYAHINVFVRTVSGYRCPYSRK